MKKKVIAFLVMVALLIPVASVPAFAAAIDDDQIYLEPGETNVDIPLLVWFSADNSYFGDDLSYEATLNVTGDLPDGLSVVPDFAMPGSSLQDNDSIQLTGDVSDSPARTSGSFTIKLDEINAPTPPPAEQSLTFSWTIHECELAVYPATLPNATVGVFYSVTLRPYTSDLSGPWCGSAGPNEVITYHDITGLPPGLNYDTATGIISGTPTTVGAYAFDAAISGETKNAVNQITLHQADGDAPLTIHVGASSPNPRNDDDRGDQPYVYYVIDSEAGKGGSITPDGLTRVDEYGSQSYTIKAEDGYVIEKVLVDGKDIGAVNKYEFTRVTANHAIQAYFAKEEATPAPSAAPEIITHNPSTGAPPIGLGSVKGLFSLTSVLLLIGGAWLRKGKNEE